MFPTHDTADRKPAGRQGLRTGLATGSLLSETKLCKLKITLYPFFEPVNATDTYVFKSKMRRSSQIAEVPAQRFCIGAIIKSRHVPVFAKSRLPKTGTRPTESLHVHSPTPCTPSGHHLCHQGTRSRCSKS